METRLSVQQCASPADLKPRMVTLTPEDGSSLAHVLAWLGHIRATGRLEVQGEGRQPVTLNLVEGALHAISAAGWDPRKALLARVAAKGTTSREELARVLQEADSEGKPLAVQLFRKGLATVQEIAQFTKQVRFGFLTTLMAKGAYQVHFVEDRATHRDAVHLPLADTVFAHYRDLLQRFTARDVEPLVAADLPHFPRARTIPPDWLAGKDRTFAAEDCNGKLDLRTLLSRCSVSSHQAARLVLLLTAFDLLDMLKQTADVQANRDVADWAAAKARDLEGGNLFDILGVHWTAHESEIKDKYKKNKERLAGFLRREGLAPDVQAALKRVETAMDKAWAVLSVKARRQQYRYDNYNPPQILFSADFLFQQGNLNKFKEDFDLAQLNYEAALDLTQDQKYSQALKDLEDARREFKERMEARERMV